MFAEVRPHEPLRGLCLWITKVAADRVVSCRGKYKRLETTEKGNGEAETREET